MSSADRREDGPIPMEGVLSAIIESLSIGVVVLDGCDRVLVANRAAGASLSDGVDVVLRDGSLVLGTGRNSKALESLLLEARNGAPHDGSGSGCVVLRSEHHGPIHVSAQRLPEGVGGPGAVVVCVVPGRRRIVPLALERAYGLSATEARMAASLVEGRSLKETAQLLGISRHTASSHLRHVFAKTSTHRRAELVALLASTLCVVDLGGNR